MSTSRLSRGSQGETEDKTKSLSEDGELNQGRERERLREGDENSLLVSLSPGWFSFDFH